MMGDDSYSALKNSLTSVPARVLNYSTRQILARLDSPQVLPSSKGYYKDYRGLAEQMLLTQDELRIIELHKDRTIKILESWQTKLDATLDKIICFLEAMDRYDIIDSIKPALERDVASYQKCLAKEREENIGAEHQPSPVQVNEVTSCPVNRVSNTSLLTLEDKKTRKITLYDAYVFYHDDDIDKVVTYTEKLQRGWGLKLFVRGRDLLLGTMVLKSVIEIMLKRCRRALLFLTPSFVNDNSLDFQTHLVADLLMLQENRRIFIPVILERCEVPPIIKTLRVADLTNEKQQENKILKNLALSIQPADDGDFPLPSLENSPLRNMIMSSISKRKVARLTNKKRKKSSAKIQKRREQKKLSMRRARLKLKENPLLLEENRKRERERYYRRKACGKIRSVNEMNEREKRLIRKVWKINARKYRQQRKYLKKTEQHVKEPP